MLAADGLYVLVVHPGVAAKSVRDLVALSKSAPGKLNAAIAGSGTPMHMGLAQFNSAGVTARFQPRIEYEAYWSGVYLSLE